MLCDTIGKKNEVKHKNKNVKSKVFEVAKSFARH